MSKKRRHNKLDIKLTKAERKEYDAAPEYYKEYVLTRIKEKRREAKEMRQWRHKMLVKQVVVPLIALAVLAAVLTIGIILAK